MHDAHEEPREYRADQSTHAKESEPRAEGVESLVKDARMHAARALAGLYKAELQSGKDARQRGGAVAKERAASSKAAVVCARRRTGGFSVRRTERSDRSGSSSPLSTTAGEEVPCSLAAGTPPSLTCTAADAADSF